jgi:hypothetical protein
MLVQMVMLIIKRHNLIVKLSSIFFSYNLSLLVIDHNTTKASKNKY